MANTVSIKKLLDGPRSAIFFVYVRNDGSSGELVDQVIIDPNSDLSPVMGSGMKLSIAKVWFSLAGFDIVLKFESTPDVPVWVLPAGTNTSKADFTEFGGLQDQSGIDATGKLLISTSGFSSSADQGSFIIKVNKTPKPFVNP